MQTRIAYRRESDNRCSLLPQGHVCKSPVFQRLQIQVTEEWLAHGKLLFGNSFWSTSLVTLATDRTALFGGGFYVCRRNALSFLSSAVLSPGICERQWANRSFSRMYNF